MGLYRPTPAGPFPQGKKYCIFLLVPPQKFKIFKKQNPPLQFWRTKIRNGHSQLVFEEKWPNYASRPKSESDSDSFWVHMLSNVCVRGFSALMWQLYLFTYEDDGASLLPKSARHFPHNLQYYQDFQTNVTIFCSAKR